MLLWKLQQLLEHVLNGQDENKTKMCTLYPPNCTILCRLIIADFMRNFTILLFTALYWSNPQYAVTLRDPDEDDEDKKCTLLVSLMQKNARALRTKRKVSMANIATNFDLYQVSDHFELENFVFDLSSKCMSNTAHEGDTHSSNACMCCSYSNLFAW